MKEEVNLKIKEKDETIKGLKMQVNFKDATIKRIQSELKEIEQ